MQTTTDPTGVTTSYTYDPIGRKLTESKAGNTQTFTYDALSHVISRTDPLGKSVNITYDLHGNISTETDARGNTTHFEYDPNGKLIRETDALQHQIQYQYDGEDRLTKVIDANGNATTFTHDAKGRVTSVTDPLGHTVSTTFDAADHETSKQDALGNVVNSITYDAAYNPIVVKDALGNTTTSQFDGLNHVIQSTNPLGRMTKYTYDDLSRLTQTTDAMNNVSQQEYDVDGNQVSVTDPDHNKTQMTYDKAGRLVSVTNSSGHLIQYQYNSLGQLSKITNGRGQERSYQYDQNGLVTGFSDADGSVTYTHDENGNLLTTTDSTGTNTRVYDAKNRLTSYTDVYGNTIQYQYDNVGNVTQMTYPDSKVVKYEYNSANQLVKVTDWNQNVTEYAYDANGNLISTTRPDGSVETKTYNVAGLVTQTKDSSALGNIISQYDFTYDAAEQVDTEKNSVTDELYQYKYDALGRLLQVADNSSTGTMLNQYDYTYDATGNLLSNTHTSQDSAPSESTNLTYSSGNQLSKYNDSSVTLDADGNMTNGPLNGVNSNYQYDSRNRLVGVADTTYGYDGDNNRILQTQNGVTTRYVNNPNSKLTQVLMTTDADGKPSEYYVYGLGLISQSDANNNTSYYHFDRRGSTVALTSIDGSITDNFKYGPYGELISHVGSTLSSFLYNGRDGVMTDANGLYYMRARYYNPQILRFINQDVVTGSIKSGQTLNRYAYVNGQPVSFVDPFGLSRDGDELIDNAHTLLDVAGNVPGLDIPSEFANALLYGYQGDYTNVVLSCFAMIPTGGEAVADARLVSKNYRKVFFDKYPELEGKVVVHHAIEQQVLRKYPNVFTEDEIHSIDNLRGIPNEMNNTMHLSDIRKDWNRFYKENPKATKEDFIKYREDLDNKYGDKFNPKIKQSEDKE